MAQASRRRIGRFFLNSIFLFSNDRPQTSINDEKLSKKSSGVLVDVPWAIGKFIKVLLCFRFY